MTKRHDCTNCDDTGYVWADTLWPCSRCEEGRKVRHKQEKAELNQNMKRARELRKSIKQYEDENHG